VATNVFTKILHHHHVSEVYLTQNVFDKNKYARTISLNAHYWVLFKNPRDATQFATLARQMYPNTSKFATEAYKDATSAPYGYLLIDLKPEQDERCHLRTNVFPGETQLVYFANKRRCSPFRIARTWNIKQASYCVWCRKTTATSEPWNVVRWSEDVVARVVWQRLNLLAARCKKVWCRQRIECDHLSC